MELISEVISVEENEAVSSHLMEEKLQNALLAISKDNSSPGPTGFSFGFFIACCEFLLKIIS